MVTNGVAELAENATEAQRVLHNESQLADILTKGLKIDRFWSHRKKLGIIQFD